MKFSGILFYSYLFFVHSCLAQSSAAGSTLAFEVASVRPSQQARNGDEARVAITPGSLTIRGVSLRFCIEWAYDTPPFQVDAPAWLSDTGFDIFAKAAQPVSVDSLRSMLRTLLVQRFGVKVHSDRKEMQVYALMLMPRGPKFRKSTTDEPSFFGNDGRAGMLAKQVTMSEFASKISEPLGRPVVDATGLQGRYDIRIDVTSYMTAPPKAGGELDMTSLLFTAFREQLGLKLVSRKSVVDILVVDHAEKAPAEN
jgi:uncharacterized protein (TIGR03435 family)